MDEMVTAIENRKSRMILLKQRFIFSFEKNNVMENP